MAKRKPRSELLGPKPREPEQRKRWADRFRYVDGVARQAIDDAIADPNLMDVRRPIGLAEAVLQATPILASESVLRRRAQLRNIQAMGPDLIAVIEKLGSPAEAREAIEALTSPTDDDLALAASELHEQSLRTIAVFSKRQVEAYKALQWAKVIRELILPLFKEFGLKVASILKRYLPDDKVEAALEEIRQALRVTVGEVAEHRDLKP